MNKYDTSPARRWTYTKPQSTVLYLEHKSPCPPHNSQRLRLRGGLSYRDSGRPTSHHHVQQKETKQTTQAHQVIKLINPFSTVLFAKGGRSSYNKQPQTDHQRVSLLITVLIWLALHRQNLHIRFIASGVRGMCMLSSDRPDRQWRTKSDDR